MALVNRVMIPELSIQNVFPIPDGNQMRDDRMRELFHDHEQGDLVALARTGYHFLHDEGRAFLAGLKMHLERGTPVRLLLEDPYSLAKTQRMSNVPVTSRWQKLAPDVWANRLKQFGEWRRERSEHNLTIRFSGEPIYCSLFFFPGSVFYDPYHLGRRDKTRETGNEFLVIEFNRQAEEGHSRSYYSLLEDHFNTLWQHAITPDQLCAGHQELHRLLPRHRRTHRANSRSGQNTKRGLKPSALEVKPDSYLFKPLAYHDSWLAVDPVVGCSLDCQYCFMQQAKWTNRSPEELLGPERIVELLLENRYFEPHETVLSFGNQTDPFLPPNRKRTVAFLRCLADREFRNPVVLTTKKLITKRILDDIRGIIEEGYVRPVFCLSYSGLPKDIEKKVNPKETEENFKLLKQYEIPCFHAWRPITRLNGTKKVLRRVLKLVSKYAHASVYIGLKMTPHLFDVYTRGVGDLLPSGEEGGYNDDLLPDEIDERIQCLAKEEFPDHPLYLHTSCALSNVLQRPDYNGTAYHPSVCKKSNCPKYQRRLCQAAKSPPTDEELTGHLTKLDVPLDFTKRKDRVEIDHVLDQEECAYLTHRIRFPVRAPIRQSRNLWGSICRLSSTTSDRR